MFKGIGVPSAAAAPAMTYDPPNHRVWFQIIIYLNCIILAVGGSFAFFFACIHFKYLTHIFIGFYMVAFGIIALLAELRLRWAQRLFGFACTSKGLGFVFIFAGTVGISFGVSKKIDIIIPFACGIVSVLVGIGCLVEEPPERVTAVENVA